MSGRFIVFEGPEGSGKSTQIARLAAELRARGYSLCVTREPGGTPLGEQIRALLLDRDAEPVVAEAEALLMTAARAQHVRNVIISALTRNEVVLCDRFTDSTLAYQGAGRGLQIRELETLQRFATDGLEPGLRLLLDLPVEAGLERRKLEGESINRLDAEGLEFHRRVRDAYLELAAAKPDAWRVIDASRAPHAVAADVLKHVFRFLGAETIENLDAPEQGG